jgi:8-oxo-dGTP pyrophosphatase MutT (NUDIX family)
MKLETIRSKLRNYKRKEVDLAEFPDFRRAGVLVLLFPHRSGLSVLLTVRTDSVEFHKGQVSFPGGMMEPGDNGIVETALRESREEIGLPSSGIEILGLLDDVPVPSKFIITPVVGYLTQQPAPKPSTSEVAEIFNAPLKFFADDRNARSEERELRGKKFPLWFYDYEERSVWGATAAILRNLTSIAR